MTPRNHFFHLDQYNKFAVYEGKLSKASYCYGVLASVEHACTNKTRESTISQSLGSHKYSELKILLSLKKK